MAESDPDHVIARILPSAGEVRAQAWDALAGAANPLVSHRFISLLETSGSVGPGTGWNPAHLCIGDLGDSAALAPAYLKSHSQGEYVFDHGWAEAFERAGGRYYPKLVIASPFSPVTGPRLLAREDAGRAMLVRAAEAVVEQNALSSAHALFVGPEDRAVFERAGWLLREDSQFHWFNQDYRDFDDFLSALSSRKRKAIRKERAAAQGGLDIRRLRGGEIERAHWDAMWRFYQDTGSRKWGRPYLTRDAFDRMAREMADDVLLVMAFRGHAPVAGALNLIGEDRLFGRYWGCAEFVPGLHFELAYYQAIEEAIERGLAVVEAGAQGEHKVARGYEPVLTHSAHYIANPSLRGAVAEFLKREREGVAAEIEWLDARGPYRKA